MFTNKKVLVLGMARSGVAVALELLKRGAIVTINDLKEEHDEKIINELMSKGANVVLGSHPEELLTKDTSYLIKNPGIKNDHLYVKKALEYNIDVINEMEVAYLLLPANVTIVGITGTNGKTTTTTLIYEILKEYFQDRVHLVGNIGYPMISFVDKIHENDIVVAEVSIQQLCNMNNFKTSISVLTNLSPAHLDFVGDYNNYLSIKKRIFNHHTKENIAVINNSNYDCLKISSDINSTKCLFSINEEKDCFIKNNTIYYKKEEIMKTNGIVIKGNHNLENIMAAICVSKKLDVSNEVINKVVNNFKGVEHRLEYVTEIKGIKFYNDSKATNNEATMIALKSFENPTILIMGGLDRHLSFDELGPYLKNVKAICCYGETKEKIVTLANSLNIRCFKFNNLSEATKKAYSLGVRNDIILLSPACASWDQYKCFEDRGLDFKNIIKTLD